MNELTRVNETRIQAQPISADLITRFLAYIDAASPRTAETYIKNLKAFAKWTSAHGISTPTRDDVIAYRDMLKATKKPATVNAYMGTVRLFFNGPSARGRTRMLPTVLRACGNPKTIKRTT